MASSGGTVRCPHCGTETPRSVIITVCQQCERSLPVGQVLEPAPVGVGRAPSGIQVEGGMSPAGIALIVIGGTMLLGLIAGAVRVGIAVDKAQTRMSAMACRSNLLQVGVGMAMFSMDHEGAAPDASTWQTDILPYVKNAGIYACLGSGRDMASYEMSPALSRANLKQLPNAQTTPLVYDAGYPNGTPPHPEGWNVVFADGHCKSVSQAEAGQYSVP